MVYADLDLSLITKRKRMMDSVGHYSRPELLSLLIDRTAHFTAHRADHHQVGRDPHDRQRRMKGPARWRQTAAASRRQRTGDDDDDDATTGLYADLQAMGVSEADAPAGASGRRGGAGPSDHRALSFGADTVMVPMRAPGRSPFRLRLLPGDGGSGNRGRSSCARANRWRRWSCRPRPRFYRLATADGVPYWKIALLHARRRAGVDGDAVLRPLQRQRARRAASARSGPRSRRGARWRARRRRSWPRWPRPPCASTGSSRWC